MELEKELQVNFFGTRIAVSKAFDQAVDFYQQENGYDDVFNFKEFRRYLLAEMGFEPDDNTRGITDKSRD